jgi:hypothetical protein
MHHSLTRDNVSTKFAPKNLLKIGSIHSIVSFAVGPPLAIMMPDEASSHHHLIVPKDALL